MPKIMIFLFDGTANDASEGTEEESFSNVYALESTYC